MFSRPLNNYNSTIDDINTSILDIVGKEIEIKITDVKNYKGHKLHFLDLSSNTITGTFKDIVGSYIIAFCIQNNIKKFVTQSSGNTANAIAYFASKHKIKAIILYPKRSRYKINSIWFDEDYITFIEVDKPESDIKELTQSISEFYEIPWLPRMPHQIDSNKSRAYLIDEFYKNHSLRFDYTTQSLSSGYGIFGLYQGFNDISEKNYTIPMLLGIQQDCVKPYIEHIYNQKKSKDSLIEPTLFRSKPTPGMLQEMKEILENHGGFIIPISNQNFENYKEKATELLNSVGITITITNEKTIEKSGLLSLIGALKSIDDGKINEPSNFLVTITGGNAKGKRDSYLPKNIIEKQDSFEKVKNIIGNK